jgi:hypothetical protein
MPDASPPPTFEHVRLAALSVALFACVVFAACVWPASIAGGHACSAHACAPWQCVGPPHHSAASPCACNRPMVTLNQQTNTKRVTALRRTGCLRRTRGRQRRLRRRRRHRRPKAGAQVWLLPCCGVVVCSGPRHARTATPSRQHSAIYATTHTTRVDPPINQPTNQSTNHPLPPPPHTHHAHTGPLCWR